MHLGLRQSNELLFVLGSAVIFIFNLLTLVHLDHWRLIRNYLRCNFRYHSRRLSSFLDEFIVIESWLLILCPLAIDVWEKLFRMYFWLPSSLVMNWLLLAHRLAQIIHFCIIIMFLKCLLLAQGLWFCKLCAVSTLDLWKHRILERIDIILFFQWWLIF